MNRTQCMTNGCFRQPAKRGLCLVCYSRAKEKVEKNSVSWDHLVSLGLCEPEEDLFEQAYKKATQPERSE